MLCIPFQHLSGKDGAVIHRHGRELIPLTIPFVRTSSRTNPAAGIGLTPGCRHFHLQIFDNILFIFIDITPISVAHRHGKVNFTRRLKEDENICNLPN